METIRTHGAPANERNEESLAPQPGREPSAQAIRLLEDWELVLAGGGDYGVAWP